MATRKSKVSEEQDTAVRSISYAEEMFPEAKDAASAKIVSDLVSKLRQLSDDGQYSELVGGLVTITPETAKALLDNTQDTSNFRRANPRRVFQYARDMRSLAWDTNCESIKLSLGGRVLDGQHRLLACVAAGVAFRTMVVANFGSKIGRSLDSGLKRTLAQVLRAEGYQYWGELAQAVRWALIIRTGNVMSCHADKYSPPEVLKFLRSSEGRDLPARVSAIARLVCNNGKFVSRGLLAGLAHASAMRHGEAAQIFVEDLLKGEGLKPNDPAHVLRRKYIEMSTHRGAMKSEIVRAALFYKALNASLAGEPMARLFWGFKEDFPLTGFEENWKKESSARERLGFPDQDEP